MDVAVTFIMGTVLRWLYDAIKKALGLKDTAALWGVLVVGLVVAVIYNAMTGGFAGLVFDLADPVQTLESVGAAWGIITSTALAWYGLTKKR